MLVLTALLLTALMVILALVIDLGFVRNNRQIDKSATDFAAAAGIRALDSGSGTVLPWLGICEARDFLIANNDELDGMTSTFADGAGGVVRNAAGDPVSDPCASPPTTPCSDSATATWGVLTGSADGGRITVEIRSGYLLGAASSGFAEDDGPYAGDSADACEQLAVIIEESEPPKFGGVAASSGHTTTIRSVARLELSTGPGGTPGLLLLERTRCEVVEIQGNDTVDPPILISGGFNEASGLIHADSNGTGSNCDATDGHIFEVNTNASYPRIIARKGTSASSAAGQLSTTALWAGGSSPFVTSGSPNEVCAQDTYSDCAVPPPTPTSITGSAPIGRALVTRSPVDKRYLEPVKTLRQRADEYFAWTTASPPPASSGFVVRPCSSTGPFTEAKIWIDCGETGTFSGKGKTFLSGVDEVVVNGRVEVDGSGSVLELVNPRAIYIRGSGTSSGMRLAGGAGNAILINRDGFTDVNSDGSICDERSGTAADRSERTKLVIGAGQLVVEGSSKTMRMCQTTVFMMDNTAGACPLPDAAVHPGNPPISSDVCRGQVQVAGQGIVDWTAPNVNLVSAPSQTELQELEDLALWTETRGASSLSRIEGTGKITLSGVFFAPNADPFRIAGQGGYNTVNAQMVSRRLEIGGGGRLHMSPDPQNAVPLPTIGGFVLVR